MKISRKVFYQTSRLLIYALALIGLIFILVFVALRFGWTKTFGVIDDNDRYFSQTAKSVKFLSEKDLSLAETSLNNCRLLIFSRGQPALGRSLLAVYQQSRSEVALAKALLAAEVFLQDNHNYQSDLKACEKLSGTFSSGKTIGQNYNWLATPEWAVLQAAIAKDEEVIIKASQRAGINPRLLVAMLAGEQLRLYNSEREVFKQIFQPLKLLGVQSKFSWGVMGMKEETAKQIENNLRDQNSPYYLGPENEHLLDFSTADQSSERFNRLVDLNNHYYSYFYSAIYLKQLMTQWQKMGYDIGDRPEILATLFNLGFDKSVPKAEPQVGGAEIEIDGQKYSFGGLAWQFYYSGELINLFPWH